jgi:hypothetical protein
MANLPPLAVTVDWAASSAAVAVHGEPDPSAYARLMERLSWVLDGLYP